MNAPAKITATTELQAPSQYVAALAIALPVGQRRVAMLQIIRNAARVYRAVSSPSEIAGQLREIADLIEAEAV